MKIPKNDIYSVSRLNGEVRKLLEGNLTQIWLNGEISNFITPSSGHWYLTLKDNQAQIRCAMFKGRNQSVTFRPQNGQQVLVKGNISVYEPRGDYQLIIDAMLAAGDGLLAQEYEALKNKLSTEGLFAQATKRELPNNIQRIGVITSPTGAAIRDVLQVLNRRDPSVEVIIYPSLVQGAQAASHLIHAIELANQRLEVDVLLLTRGGGSLEDLWCFNSETLAHSIYNSALPVISAVGHEIDTTISDYVADVRAPTPSAAAEILSKDSLNKIQKLNISISRIKSAWQHYFLKSQRKLSLIEHRISQQDPDRKLTELVQRFDDMQFKLMSVFNNKLSNNKFTLQALNAKLNQVSPQNKLNLESKRLTYLIDGVHQGIENQLKQAKQDLQHQAKLLESVSPLATLSRGYSITTNDNHQVIDTIEQVKTGDTIYTKLKQGNITSIVSKTTNI